MAEQTWSTRFFAIRDFLVSLGTTVSTKGGAQLLPIIGVRFAKLLPFYDVDGDHIKTLTDQFTTAVTNNWPASDAQSWANGVANSLAEGSRNAALIIAAKHFLEVISRVKFDVKSAGDTKKVASVSSGIDVHFAGADTKSEGAESLEMSASYSLDSVVVGALEVADVCIAYELQQEPPSTADAMELFVHGFIDADAAEVMVRCNGDHWPTVKKTALTRSVNLSPNEAIQYYRRNPGDVASFKAIMMRAGVYDDVVAERLNYLYDELPSISDHLHWLQRNVFNDDYVAQYRLLEGFEDRFWKKFGGDLQAQGYTKQRAEYEYASHWIMPSPTQMQEFIHRLSRKDDGDPAKFTVADYKRILAEQDYNIVAQEWFAATAYKVPALGYLRDMHRQNLLTDDQMAEYHAQLGYTVSDSKLFVEVDAIRRNRMRASQSHGWTPAALASAYANGLKTPPEVIEGMAAQGWTTEEAQACMQRALADLQARVITRARSRVLSGVVAQVRESLRTGVVDKTQAASMLEAAGWPSAMANSIASLESIAGHNSRIKAAISRIRHAYLSGEIAIDAVPEALESMGITADAIRDYVTVWTLSMTPNRKRRTASEIVKSRAMGDIDDATAGAMLHNLGYNDTDTMLYEADWKRKIAALDAKRQKALDATGRAKEKALADTAKQAKALARSAQKELMREAPLARLMKWASMGIINERIFRSRLVEYGYPADNIDLYWQQACAGKGAKCEPGEPSKGAPGAPSGNANQLAPLAPGSIADLLSGGK